MFLSGFSGSQNTVIELPVLINKMPCDCDIPFHGKTSPVIGSERDAWLRGDSFNQVSLELITRYGDILGDGGSSWNIVGGVQLHTEIFEPTPFEDTYLVQVPRTHMRNLFGTFLPLKFRHGGVNRYSEGSGWWLFLDFISKRVNFQRCVHIFDVARQCSGASTAVSNLLVAQVTLCLLPAIFNQIEILPNWRTFFLFYSHDRKKEGSDHRVR